MNAFWRAKAVIVDPSAAWRRIAEEPADAAYLLTTYVAILALIPALASFIGGCLIGAVAPAAGVVRTPLFAGMLGAIFGYVATFAKVLLVALLIEALAPLFGAQRNFAGALKLAVYSFTPVWLAGIFLLLPGLRFLELAGLYGVYILAKGLRRLTKSPAQTSQPYAAIIVGFAAVLTVLTAVVQRRLFGLTAL